MWFNNDFMMKCFQNCNFLNVIKKHAILFYFGEKNIYFSQAMLDTQTFAHIELSSHHSNLQICLWIMDELRLKLKLMLLTQKMNHGTCSGPRSSEQLSQQTGCRGLVHYGSCFHDGVGWMLEGHFQIMEADQIRTKKNNLWCLTWVHRSKRKGVIPEWLPWWLNSPAISSHSCVERSWLSPKW